MELTIGWIKKYQNDLSSTSVEGCPNLIDLLSLCVPEQTKSDGRTGTSELYWLNDTNKRMFQ